MTNEELLLEKNLKPYNFKISIADNMAIYKTKKSHFHHFTLFNYNTLKSIINFCNVIKYKYHNISIPISFELDDICFNDKLVYVVFECICNCLISNWGHDVYVQFENSDSIWTAGVRSSPLLLLTTGEKKHIDKYKRKFQKDIFHYHYRKIANGDEQTNSDFLCKLMDDIEIFLKAFSVKKEYRDEISEVIVELIGNAGEHTGTDCLVDLDVSPRYTLQNDPSEYYGINLAIVNFSNKLLGDGIKIKIDSSEILDDRHELVKQAYKHHQNGFSEKYTEEDFFRIASFQHRVSEREKSKYTGGTGLTKLICSLERRSESHNCYVLSGNGGILFNNEYLEYNSENWIGFNKENDFLNHIPDSNNIKHTNFFFPGTAYNLNFIMKGEQ